MMADYGADRSRGFVPPAAGPWINPGLPRPRPQVKRVKGDYLKDPAFTLDNIKTISTAGGGAAHAPPPAISPLACGLCDWRLSQPRPSSPLEGQLPTDAAVCAVPLRPMFMPGALPHATRPAQVGAGNGQLLRRGQGRGAQTQKGAPLLPS